MTIPRKLALTAAALALAAALAVNIIPAAHDRVVTAEPTELAGRFRN